MKMALPKRSRDLEKFCFWGTKTSTAENGVGESQIYETMKQSAPPIHEQKLHPDKRLDDISQMSGQTRSDCTKVRKSPCLSPPPKIKS